MTFDQPSNRSDVSPYQIAGPVRGLGQTKQAGRYDKTPLQDGSTLRNIDVGNRAIVFRCLIEGSSPTDWRDRRNTLRTILRPTIGAEEIRLGSLEIALDNGVTRSIPCFTTEFGSHSNSVLKPEYSIETIRFICPSPWFLNTVRQTYNQTATGRTFTILGQYSEATVGPPGGFLFDQGGMNNAAAFPVSFGGTRPTARMTVNNIGDVIVYPSLLATGEISNLSIRNNTTNESIAIDATIPANGDLEINSLNRTVGYQLRGLKENLFNNLKSGQANQFITLLPGMNEITIEQDELGTPWLLTYNPGYVGI